ncbi:MAG: MBL fold metallo-hydrolase [Burkholderiales bacterium]|nr:MBL fold metallo-hydrolase [Burkholderiales bacterium]
MAAGCSRGPSGGTGGEADTQVTPAVQQANEAVAKAADLSDPPSFADARRGFVAAPTGQVKDAQGRVIWDFDAFAFVKGAAPATVNPSLWRQALLNSQVGLFKVAERIWQLRGFDLANLTLIEGASGWIVVDTLTARETAAAAMAFARRHLGDRKVTGIVFTHSHVDHFGGVLGVISAEEARARQVPVVAPAGFMAEATSENLMMGGAMPRRSMYMYGDRLPRSAAGLVDNGLGKAVAYGRVGILQPTVVVEAPRQELVIDGVRFVFHNVPGTEAPAEFVFMLPELKAFGGAELMSHTLHNLYTLRGAKVRDALRWADDLDRSLEWSAGAEVVFNQHHWPVWGAGRIREFIVKQRDAYRYIHDQTVRLVNAGLTGPEIADDLQLPKSLQDYLNVRGYYGTVRHNARAVYQFYMGWYDANPANLNPLPPAAAGRRYVALAGGSARLVAAAQQAFDAGDFRWAAELLKHAVHADPKDKAAGELLARCFEQMGYQAESAPWRNVYLTGALELRQGAPAEGLAPALLLDMLQHTPIERFLDRMAASVVGPKADGLDLRINLNFADLGENHVLWLENAVLHHRKAPPDPDANATLTLTLTKPFFLQMMTGGAGAKDLLLSDQTKIDGSRIDLGRFFALIEKAPGNFPIVTR